MPSFQYGTNAPKQQGYQVTNQVVNTHKTPSKPQNVFAGSLNASASSFTPADFNPSAATFVPTTAKKVAPPAPPKKTEEEIKIEKRLATMVESLDSILPVYKEIVGAEKLTEAMLRKFIELANKRTENVTSLVSVNHVVA